MLNDANPDELIRAAGANHRRWMMDDARNAGSGRICRRAGALWVYAPSATDPRVTLPFPVLRGDAAARGETLDDIVAFCRSLDPPASVGCWAMRDDTNAPTRDLGVRLAARGFEWGWEAHWMSLDLATLPGPNSSLPPNLQVALVDEPIPDADGDDLPYYTRPAAPPSAPEAAPTSRRRRDRWHFAARQDDGKVVGHVTLFVNRGAWGVAGIYSMGVVPAARRRGVGGALMNAACRLARDEAGCRWALLNATGEGELLYRSLGWQSLGRGQTWWLHRPVLLALPPSPDEIAFAEALGRGDIAGLNELANAGRVPADLDTTPLTNGQTPFQFAARAGQSASAEWLLARGAPLDLLSAWDLGWKKRVEQLLAAAPWRANGRATATAGENGVALTPLHEAVLRNDAELARVLLAAGADLSIPDPDYHSTPLGWARHFARTELIALLEAHEREQGG